MPKFNFSKILLFFLCLIITETNFSAFTQNTTQTVRGRVIDQDSNLPLPGANIIILNSNPILGTSTNVDGIFEIENVPLGRHSIKVSFIGYEPRIISNLLVGAGKEVILNVELIESLVSTKEVVIEAEMEKDKPLNEMASISARAFTVEETGRYAASINDPARMALSFAGVSIGSSDAQNLIVIRGNSPMGMLWQIEGIPVSNPNHFAEEGSSGGAVCLISNNMLDNSDFLIGAWPAGFGNAISGVFDINFRNGNSENFEHSSQLGGLGADISSEGPIPFFDGASYLINYRYSTLSLLAAAGINIVDKDKGRPDYQDLSYKIYIPSKTFGLISIWGIGGISNSEYKSEISRGLTYDNKEYFFLDEEGEKTSSDIGILGLTHTYFTDNQSFIKSALTYNGEKLNNNEDGIIESKVCKINTNDFTKSKFSFSSLYNRKVNASFSFKTGVIIDYLDFSTKSSEYNNDVGKFYTNVDATGNSIFYQAYFQSKYKINNGLNIFTGLHSTLFKLNNKSTIEPRFSLNWNITKFGSLTIGYGLHSQMHPLSLYLMNFTNENGETFQFNKSLDFSKAEHFGISYDNLFFDNWRVKLELYFQDLYNIPIAKDTSNTNYSSEFLKSLSTLNLISSLDFVELVNNGTGKNYGTELTIEKFLESGWYFLYTVSIYHSKYTALDGIERNTRFNGNYTLNLLAGKEIIIGANNILGINTRIIWAGGKRVNPVKSPEPQFDDLGNPIIDPITGNQIFEIKDDYTQAFSKQLNSYFRIDLGISYRLNYENTAHIFSFDIQNLTNRKNIRKIDKYDVVSGQYIYKYQAGIIPTVNYRFEF